ncbi:MAG: DUF1285 domain-containing protein [Alphaproteobacteria bacterium]|nr:DUF1285 domain-containing protein [Alphaproteobacteria bacterium]
MHWGAPAPDLLRGLAEVQAESAHTRKLPPIEKWNPPDCGDIDMRIAVDGTWFYLGTPIGRPALVRLFSTILKREANGRYVLVTPVEKVGLTVEDAPFTAVRVDAEARGPEQQLTFMTNVGDSVVAGPEHMLRVEFRGPDREPRPYLHVRAGLEALVSRAVFYELVGLAEERATASGRELGVWSGGVFFSLGSPE